MPGIVAGVLLTFIPAFGDYINAQLLGGTQQAMIGNVIQSLYLNQRDYPEAAALSFLMMALILAIVVVYIRFAGTEAFMGEEDEEAGWMTAAPRAWAWLRRNALHDLRRARRRLHADPDRRDRRLLLRRRRRKANSTFGLDHGFTHRVLAARPSRIPELNDALLHQPQARGARDR